MEYKYNFETEEERINLLEQNEDKYLREVVYALEENYLIFADEPQEPQEPTEIELMQNEIKALREELTQIQTSIASLTSLIAKTLEEK